MLNWLTAELVPERHIFKLLYVAPPICRETFSECAQSSSPEPMGDQECAERMKKYSIFVALNDYLKFTRKFGTK